MVPRFHRGSLTTGFAQHFMQVMVFPSSADSPVVTASVLFVFLPLGFLVFFPADLNVCSFLRVTPWLGPDVAHVSCLSVWPSSVQGAPS